LFPSLSKESNGHSFEGVEARVSSSILIGKKIESIELLMFLVPGQAVKVGKQEGRNLMK
jgi:hypothetical protein